MSTARLTPAQLELVVAAIAYYDTMLEDAYEPHIAESKKAALRRGLDKITRELGPTSRSRRHEIGRWAADPEAAQRNITP